MLFTSHIKRASTGLLLLSGAACGYLDDKPAPEITQTPLAITLPSPDCIDINKKGWFSANEKKYPAAHTNICHVGKSINGLIGRLENRGGSAGPHCNPAAAASTYPDTATAQRVIANVISANTSEIDNWFETTAAPNWATAGFLDETTGTVVAEYLGKPGKNRKACPGNSSYTCQKSMKARVVLRRQGSQCFVLTAYPS